MAEVQTIPARHGTATFVPAGQIIKIINVSGSQVIDTWAFALPKPEPKKSAQPQKQDKEVQQSKEQSKEDNSQQPKASSKTKKKSANLPSQEEAEQMTQQALKEEEDDGSATVTEQKSTWGSYVPTSYVPTKIWPSFKKDGSKNTQAETEQQKNSRTWASYFPSGKGFTNYIPQTATDTVSAFAESHKRDPNKSYLEQLQDLSKTPVGAAGLAALTGSGWSGSTLAGYQAWNSQNAANVVPMEFMSMPHSRAASLHLRPRVNDTLVTNLREPILTLIEDSSNGVHDTLIAACDPARYRGLGVENWEEHGSCAENLVLALKELNGRAGLKGAKAVGAEVTINSVPAPLNLFMNIPWDNSGEISFDPPKCKPNDYVRLKAERDVVVVMSSCPQDILPINNGEPSDAQFLVEGEEEPTPAIKRTQVRKRPPPRKISSSHATSTVGTETGPPTANRPPPPRRAVPQKRQGPTAAVNQGTAQAQPVQRAAAAPARKKPVPAPVAPQKKPDVGGAKEASPAKSAAPTVEKKKPRKLNPKPKAETQSAS